mgnify:FL=1|tara:strand:+ start:1678 stop:2469 length:792 start_codon:yes stop_codon:yes gene_type:complete
MIQYDCHAHVYETVTAVDGARYVPATTAPLSAWLKHQRDHGLRGGVIVQVSFLGTDNSEMCAALAGLDRQHFAGVGVVGLDIGDDELDQLDRAGMRGVRWNLVRGAEIPDFREQRTQAFFQKLRNRNLHLEVHLEGPRLAPHLAELADQGVPLVVDHFGLPSDPLPKNDPLIQAVIGLKDRSTLYFKLAAHYRIPFDVRPHAESLLSLLPDDHAVWGSDWPHTQHEHISDYRQVMDFCGNWGGKSDLKAVQRLYGIGSAPEAP